MWNEAFCTFYGKFALNESSANRHLGEGLSVSFGTDSAVSNNTFPSPDILSTQTAATRTLLVAAGQCPPNFRPYLTRLDMSVDGSFDWAGNTSITIEDTFGDLLAYYPLVALRHGISQSFPSTGHSIPMLVGPGANCITTISSYVASTGVITLGANVLVSGLLVGTPIQVVDYAAAGTLAFSPVGQMMMITANTASTITVAQNNAAAALGFPNPIDTNATLALPYWCLASVADSTHLTLLATGTPFTANQFDNGYSVVGVQGASVGTVRTIQSNTNAGAIVLGSATNTAFNATTSLVQITNQPELFGSLDGCVGQKWRAAYCPVATASTIPGQQSTPLNGAGIQAVMNGSPSAGSPIRFYGDVLYNDYQGS
jgi:hypothetical protein